MTVIQRDPALEKKAAARYSDAMPYHNFQHVQDCLAAAENLLSRCREESVQVDAEVVYHALLFHDAGYHENHSLKGFATKESYSAALAVQVLIDHGVAGKQVDRVVAAIEATQRDALFTTNEQKLVRAADLAWLAADYEVFRTNTEHLKQEYETLTGKAISWSQWIDMADEIISHFLSQDIHLTSYYADVDGRSVFHKRTRENLNRLRTERAARLDDYI